MEFFISAIAGVFLVIKLAKYLGTVDSSGFNPIDSDFY